MCTSTIGCTYMCCIYGLRMYIFLSTSRLEVKRSWWWSAYDMRRQKNISSIFQMSIPIWNLSFQDYPHAALGPQWRSQSNQPPIPFENFMFWHLQHMTTTAGINNKNMTNIIIHHHNFIYLLCLLLLLLSISHKYTVHQTWENIPVMYSSEKNDAISIQTCCRLSMFL